MTETLKPSHGGGADVERWREMVTVEPTGYGGPLDDASERLARFLASDDAVERIARVMCEGNPDALTGPPGDERMVWVNYRARTPRGPIVNLLCQNRSIRGGR